MHAKALEIAWHEASPVWSVDVSCADRLVTAGGDMVARVWRLQSPPPRALAPGKPHVNDTAVEWLSDLRAHTAVVNVARFSPSGRAIATAADQGELMVWELCDGAVAAPSPLEAAAEGDAAESPKEKWSRAAMLRGHLQDVLDVAWGSDGHTLVSASVDNSVMIWDVRDPNRRPITLSAHSNFVQGVAIDPVGKIVTSLGNDRHLRVFSRAGNMQWAQVASLASITADARLFADDSKYKGYFRRLAWSPDGSVVACPTGLQFPQEKRMFAVHLFARFQWSQPAVQCGGLCNPPSGVRFSPVLYALRRDRSPDVPVATPEAHSSTASQSSNMTAEGSKDEPAAVAQKRAVGPFEGFLYRMVFAVTTAEGVLFYDTESFSRPFATVKGLHYAEHTDLAWSADGLRLFVSSIDGYVSVITFEPAELGTPLREDQMPRWLREYSLPRRQNAEPRTSGLVKATRVRANSSERPSQSLDRQGHVPKPVQPMPRPVQAGSTKVKSPKLAKPPTPPTNTPNIPNSKTGRPKSPLIDDDVKNALLMASATVRADTDCVVTVPKTSGTGFRISPSESTVNVLKVSQSQPAKPPSPGSGNEGPKQAAAAMPSVPSTSKVTASATSKRDAPKVSSSPAVTTKPPVAALTLENVIPSKPVTIVVPRRRPIPVVQIGPVPQPAARQPRPAVPRPVALPAKTAAPANDALGMKADTPGIKGGTPVVKAVTPLAKESLRVVKAGTPAVKAVVATGKVSPPVVKVDTSLAKAVSVAIKVSPPVVEAGTPVVKVISAGAKVSPPVVKSGAPLVKAVAAVTKQSPPVAKSGSSSVKAVVATAKASPAMDKSCLGAAKSDVLVVKASAPAVKAVVPRRRPKGTALIDSFFKKVSKDDTVEEASCKRKIGGDGEGGGGQDVKRRKTDSGATVDLT